MPFGGRITLRKWFILEYINNMLKNMPKLVYLRHRAINNFLMNLIAVLATYCFYDNKPETFRGIPLNI